MGEKVALLPLEDAWADISVEQWLLGKDCWGGEARRSFLSGTHRAHEL